MEQQKNNLGGYLRKLALANSDEEKKEIFEIVKNLVNSHAEKNLLLVIVEEAKIGKLQVELRNQVTPPPDLSVDGITSQIADRNVMFSW